MTAIRNIIKRQPVLAYFVLTFILTWGCMALAVYPSGFPISEEQLETSGALVYMAMLVGPSGAGLLLTGLLDGRKGYHQFLSRLTHWRVRVGWYAVALLTAPIMIVVLLSGLSLVSAEFQPALFAADEKTALVLSSVAVGLAVGLFEEIGWTGFAVPRLMQRYSVLKTGLIVGVIWGAWHFPPFWKSDTFSATLPLMLLLAQLFSWLPPYRILMVWIYDRTGSLFLSVLMHASLMGSLNALVPGELTGMALLTWILVWAAALWLIVGAGVLVSRKKRSRPHQSVRQAATSSQ